jgi:cytochrome c biogenesis protein ResB
MIAPFRTKRVHFGHSDKKVGVCNCLFSTGITVYMENGGSLETAAHIAAHESPRTTKLYDRTADNITLEEIERIRF